MTTIKAVDHIVLETCEREENGAKYYLVGWLDNQGHVKHTHEISHGDEGAVCNFLSTLSAFMGGGPCKPDKP